MLRYTGAAGAAEAAAARRIFLSLYFDGWMPSVFCFLELSAFVHIFFTLGARQPDLFVPFFFFAIFFLREKRIIKTYIHAISWSARQL